MNGKSQRIWDSIKKRNSKRVSADCEQADICLQIRGLKIMARQANELAEKFQLCVEPMATCAGCDLC